MLLLVRSTVPETVPWVMILVHAVPTAPVQLPTAPMPFIHAQCACAAQPSRLALAQNENVSASPLLRSA